MHYLASRSAVLILLMCAVAAVEARVVSRQSAEAFAQKITLIRQQGEVAGRAGTRKTPVTQDELNSWFTYLAQPVLPSGVAQPPMWNIGNMLSPMSSSLKPSCRWAVVACRK